MTEPELPLFHLVARPAVAAPRAPLVILLHGYGSNEQDLFELAPYLDRRLLVLSLRAPLPLGYGAYAWFEIAFTQEGIAVDPEQAEQSRLLLVKLIEDAVAGYDADPARVVLVGFSQGATMAALVALTRPDLVVGAAILSGIVPDSLLDKTPAHTELAGRRFLVIHGTQDIVVPVAHGRATRALLERLPVDLIYREYPMGHTIGAETLRDLTMWLAAGIAGETGR